MNSIDQEELRLVAQDEADIEVVSTLLQDAIIAGTDMQFDKQNNCFLFVANRFCWERPPLEGVNDSFGGAVYERTLCGVRISYVAEVQRRSWPTHWRDAFFNLLTVRLMNIPQKPDTDYLMELSFSSGPSLRLLVKHINITLGDLVSGRPTNLQPRHDL